MDPASSSTPAEFREDHVRRAGALLLAWSGVHPGNTGDVEAFLAAAGDSSVPQAAAAVGDAIREHAER